MFWFPNQVTRIRQPAFLFPSCGNWSVGLTPYDAHGTPVVNGHEFKHRMNVRVAVPSSSSEPVNHFSICVHRYRAVSQHIQYFLVLKSIIDGPPVQPPTSSNCTSLTRCAIIHYPDLCCMILPSSKTSPFVAVRLPIPS